jgi:hypothetical protein
MIARMWRRTTLALLLVVSLAPAVSAQIYRWVDDRGNSHYADGLLNVPEAFRSRATPLGLRNQPAPPPGAAGDRTPNATSAAGGALVRYTPGQRIVVDVRLNDRTTARLLLDTGADRTLISPSSLTAAGASLQRAVARGEIRGVTGSDQVLYVVLDSIEVGEARVERLPVMAYEMGSRESDGLLGRDFLERFNVSIDAGRGIVTLSPK